MRAYRIITQIHNYYMKQGRVVTVLELSLNTFGRWFETGRTYSVKRALG